MASRFFDLRDEHARAAASNGRTLMWDRDQLRALEQGPRLSCEVAFVSHYEAIRALCQSVEKPGLAVFAIDDDGVAARAVLGASPKGIRTAIIGRHTRADVWVDDPGLALRHLALVVYPHEAEQAVQYRVVDLRTQIGFRDERRMQLEAFEADGPVFIELGRFVVLFLTLDGQVSWPDDPMAAWKALPKREYRASHQGAVQRPRRRVLAGRPVEATATGVQLMPGPIAARRQIRGDDDDVLGELRVKSADGEITLTIGSESARTGVLLGRYDRCDNGGLPVLSNRDISRVHVLLLLVDGVLYAIDAGSTNGVWVGRTEVRVHPLRFRDNLELGHNLAWVRWMPVH